MKAFLLVLAMLWIGAMDLGAEGVQWFTDIKAAAQKATQEKKAIMLDFTGSDWCGWCMKLKQEVFDQPEFAEFARDHLVAVEVDFPRKKTLSDDQQQVNSKLLQMFHIEGFPTIILLDPQGKVFGKTGYRPGGPRAFIAEVAGMLHLDAPAEAPPEPPEQPRKPITFVPAPTSVPTHYGALALKGISGTKDRRMVLINNATLMTGETAKVKANGQEIVVVCKEIRDQSVLITADGKPLELKLGAH